MKFQDTSNVYSPCFRPVSKHKLIYDLVEIHNKYSDANHTPDITTCEAYLMEMTDAKANGKNCYGSKNKDTKGGTWQVGSSKISYHALPAKN